MATIVVGGCSGGGGGSASNGGPGPGEIVETLNFTITDALKEMVTHEPNSPLANPARCYFWAFKEDRFPVDCPGPQIFAVEGDRIALNVTNDLDVPHAFFIEGMVDTGPIQPGDTWSGEFTASQVGTFLYHDNLNAPVNRVMGLHGAFVVMPLRASGARWTPYKHSTPAVQRLYNDFGSTPWWPGLAWEQGDADAASFVLPFRQYVWLCHQASPVLFAEVGELARTGQLYDPAAFVEAFTNDPFVHVSNDPRSLDSLVLPKVPTFNRKPHFFTINGQSGFFAHHNATITPMHRIGEPALVRILNAGLMAHSMHLHANHFYVTAVNNVPQENVLWLDVFSLHAMEHLDYTIPFMRPPDVPNVRGIGRADRGLSIQGGGRTWPPEEELGQFFPPVGTNAQSFENALVEVDLAVQQSPLCYPMHDHSEPSQTAQGGNYNCGLIAGINFLGDRTPGGEGLVNFPIPEDFQLKSDNALYPVTLSLKLKPNIFNLLPLSVLIDNFP
jgi:hypothetical protein